MTLEQKPIAAKWKQLLRHRNLPFLVLALLMLLIFLGKNLIFNDDMAFLLRGLTPWQFAVNVSGSSTRFLIDLLNMWLILVHPLVFIVSNALIYVLLAYSIVKLFAGEQTQRTNWLACALVFMYPVTDMMTAGWIATSLAYSWTLALGIYAAIPWKLYLEDKKVPVHTAALSLPAVVYASFSQQMMAIIGGSLLVVCIYMIARRKRFTIYHIAFVLAYLAVCAYVFFNGGTETRIMLETASNNPTFGSLSYIEKLYETFIQFSRYFIGYGKIATLFASLSISILVFAQHKDAFYRFLAASQLFLVFVIGVGSPVTLASFPALERLLQENITYRNFTMLYGYVAFLVYIYIWIAYLLCCYLAFDNLVQACSMTLVNVAALLATMLLFISPSLYASIPRYFIFLHFSLLITGFAAVVKLLQGKFAKYGKGLQWFIGGSACLGCIQLFMSL